MNRELRLSYAFNKSLGRYIALVSDLHLANGDPKTNVLTTAVLQSEADVVAWFEDMKARRPWETGGRRPPN